MNLREYVTGSVFFTSVRARIWICVQILLIGALILATSLSTQLAQQDMILPFDHLQGSTVTPFVTRSILLYSLKARNFASPARIFIGWDSRRPGRARAIPVLLRWRMRWQPLRLWAQPLSEVIPLGYLLAVACALSQSAGSSIRQRFNISTLPSRQRANTI